MNLVPFFLNAKHACCLIKFEGGGGRARSSTIINGYTSVYPRLGDCFYMVGEPLNGEADYRVVNTSPIIEAEMLADGKGIRLVTASGSRYLLQIYSDVV